MGEKSENGPVDHNGNWSQVMKRLEELQKQLPPGGQIDDPRSSAEDRKLAVFVEFLAAMLKGCPATAKLLSDHPAYKGRGLNFVVQLCKRKGLQWFREKGAFVFPATGANILKLCSALIQDFHGKLDQVEVVLGGTLDEVVTCAEKKLESELDALFAECIPERDEFVDIPDDYALATFNDSPKKEPESNPTDIAFPKDYILECCDFDDGGFEEQLRQFHDRVAYEDSMRPEPNHWDDQLEGES